MVPFVKIVIVDDHRRREILRGLRQIIFARPQKTFISRQIQFSVTRPSIKINPVEGTGPPYSQSSGQLHLLPCSFTGAGHDDKTVMIKNYNQRRYRFGDHPEPFGRQSWLRLVDEKNIEKLEERRVNQSARSRKTIGRLARNNFWGNATVGRSESSTRNPRARSVARNRAGSLQRRRQR